MTNGTAKPVTGRDEGPGWATDGTGDAPGEGLLVDAGSGEATVKVMVTWCAPGIVRVSSVRAFHSMARQSHFQPILQG